MLTYVTVDINCPNCFNNVIESIASRPGVESIDPNVVRGCLAITHELDEAELIQSITSIGHTLDIAPNGEIMMGEAHAQSMAICDHH